MGSRFGKAAFCVALMLCTPLAGCGKKGSNNITGPSPGPSPSGNWTQTSGPVGGTVVAFATLGSSLFAGTNGGVFLSTNSGTSWTAVNTGLTNTVVNALAVSGSNLFAGTAGGGVWRRSL